MFEGLGQEQLSGAIEALLFVTDEPVSAITLAEMLQVKPSEVLQACYELRDRLVECGSGIQLQEIAGGWQLSTRQEFHSLLEQYVLSWDTRKLSQAMMEVLSVVAYTQPVTRQGVASVRGVNSDSSINSLIDKGLIREAGVADTPGNPVLYATTRSFLEKFGLNSLSELPDLERFAPDDETKHFIVSRLSAARSEGLMVIQSYDDDDEAVQLDSEELTDSMGDVAREMMLDQIAASVGLVEKIDFDDLQFEE